MPEIRVGMVERAWIVSTGSRVNVQMDSQGLSVTMVG